MMNTIVRLISKIEPVIFIWLNLINEISIKMNIKSIEPFSTRLGTPDISRRPKINTYVNSNLNRFRYLLVEKKPIITARNIRIIIRYKYICLY